MVSPCKTAQAKSRDEASKVFKPLGKYVFYLDIKNSGISKLIENKIKKFGGRIEVFLVDGVTHIVSDTAASCTLPTKSPSAALPSPANSPLTAQTWVCGGRSRRADAMLERAGRVQTAQQPARPQHNLPVWTLHKIKQFLSRIGALAYRRVLQEPFIKFEAIDKKSRVVYKELVAWPELNLRGEHSGCPFNPPPLLPQAPASVQTNHRKHKQGTHNKNTPDSQKRMTKKNKVGVKEQIDHLPAAKQSGYCEICRVDYSHLPDHERSATHINFIKNCSNFLSLDSLIGAGADVEAFLKMNRSNTIHTSLERRSLRNVSKHEDTEPKKQLEIMCNGGSEPVSRHLSPREKRAPTPAEGKHFLRSKGPEPDCPPPPPEVDRDMRNGSLSPQVDYQRMNGGSGINKKGKKKGWRRPSSPIRDPPAYYKVVGMSTKLRSSTSFAPTPPPSHRLNACNGDANPGLVVKFRKVRRSELSVLSDEAENFMFPKKDDSDAEEDDDNSKESPEKDNSVERQDLKDEPASGDDASQDSCGSDMTRRNPRRRTHVESYKDHIDFFGFDIPPSRPRKRRSKSPEEKAASLPVEAESTKVPEIAMVKEEKPSGCLKWEEGRLRASDQVESLTYTFERVPHSEPWFDTFQRQDQGKENTKSIIKYLEFFNSNKSPILPYEMSELPPLKPNCCVLSQIKKPEPKSGPSRSYGTRGMKKKKIKIDPIVTLGLNPRKSPREHASTLAILGGLIHRKRSKLSGSEDSKSLPSIAEEETSSDTTQIHLPKLPENPILEASKQLEALLSSVFEDDEEFDVPQETIVGLKFEKPIEKLNVMEMLQNYEKCDTIENTVKEINDNIQADPPKRRKGYKFKKKNKTGWPNKKKIPKKDTASTCSSRDASANREVPESVFEAAVDASAQCATKHKSKNSFVHLNENSITSSETEDNDASISSKCKATDTEHSEDDNFVSNWECKVKQKKCNNLDLQPVVRVLKMEEATARRLRSTAVNRRLRARHRPYR